MKYRTHVCNKYSLTIRWDDYYTNWKSRVAIKPTSTDEDEIDETEEEGREDVSTLRLQSDLWISTFSFITFDA